jgi:hypothetical protein
MQLPGAQRTIEVARAISPPRRSSRRRSFPASGDGVQAKAFGGAWARLEALDSLRWPYLDAPVIHGPAVAVRPVLGSGSANRPGQDPGGHGAPAWRALDPWEAENALWALRRYVLPLQPLSCPVDQAFLNSICWPVHAAYREAKRSGDSAAMLRIRLELQRERAEWALARG